MEPAVLEFCSLPELVDWAHSDSPSPQCAYLLKAGSPCKARMKHGTSNQVILVIKKYLDILIGTSETYGVSVPQHEFLWELATIQLCSSHKKHHHARAIVQWLNEYTAQKASIVASLTKYYNMGVDDTLSGDSDSDADNKQDISEEDTLVELEEDISIMSSQSLTSNPSMRHKHILAKDEVAKEVTLLLQQSTSIGKKKSEKPGWIYVISPSGMPGILKVGHTIKHHPDLGRFIEHKRCYGEFKIVKTKLIPYVYRVEQLLLKELVNQELQMKCLACDNRVHHELFKVDQEYLLSCLDKWINFVESLPYSRQGVLTKEAKEKKLPEPALKSYLGCKPTTRRSLGATPKKKGGNQSAASTPSSANSKTPTSTAKDMRSPYTEDDLCSDIADIQLTPSKNERDSPTPIMPGSFEYFD